MRTQPMDLNKHDSQKTNPFTEGVGFLCGPFKKDNPWEMSSLTCESAYPFLNEPRRALTILARNLGNLIV